MSCEDPAILSGMWFSQDFYMGHGIEYVMVTVVSLRDGTSPRPSRMFPQQRDKGEEDSLSDVNAW